MVCPYNGLLGSKKKWSTGRCYNIESWKSCADERSHSQIVWVHLHKMSRIDKYIETESRLAVVYLLGEEKMGRIYYGGGCTIPNILKANCTP